VELRDIRIDRSSPGRTRLTGVVLYERDRKEEEYWFDVPDRHAGELSESGNAWLVCLAPLAATLGEPLRIGRPVDRLLARNVREALAVWRVWYSRLHDVPFDLEISDAPAARGPRRIGAFFSGGIDSFYTVLRHVKGGAGTLPLDDLILVRGFDFPLVHAQAFDRHRGRMAAAAEELGLHLVDVVTNLRETRLREAEWGALWHGAALASVGLALEHRYRYLLVAASLTYGELEPYGSHPLTDPLLSTSSTRVLHEGADVTRLDKVADLAGSDLALRFLHVCFRVISDINCGRCRKCLMAMTGLTLFGAGGRSATFSPDGPDLARLRRILFSRGQRHGVRRLRTLAARQGRRELVRALDHAWRRSIVLRTFLEAFQKAHRFPTFAAPAAVLRRALLHRVVR
jgi:hypothetical protein